METTVNLFRSPVERQAFDSIVRSATVQQEAATIQRRRDLVQQIAALDAERSSTIQRMDGDLQTLFAAHVELGARYHASGAALQRATAERWSFDCATDSRRGKLTRDLADIADHRIAAALHDLHILLVFARAKFRIFGDKSRRNLLGQVVVTGVESNQEVIASFEAAATGGIDTLNRMLCEPHTSADVTRELESILELLKEPARKLDLSLPELLDPKASGSAGGAARALNLA